ncbi:hypothetical protein [Mesorhizobium sp.]|uniref:hypothetical protein n=1 Tax=Mesorhizobium sp. TaxID=1871066 RepID=UPI000FE5847B|nr:hypothetical protein [Mesorhizobium sp.]RWM84297.1 MAG: hypothetical protein EOR83_16880 [Mesorhizobium sp.]
MAHPRFPDRVVRVALYDRANPTADKAPEDGWLHYMERFGTSRSRHVPKVYSITLYAEFYVVEMERLERIPFDLWNKSGLHEAYYCGLDSELSDHRVGGSIRTLYRRILAEGAELGSRGGPDLHEDNFMLRGDTIVATDPFYMRRAA